jgi:hypothetical protein
MVTVRSNLRRLIIAAAFLFALEGMLFAKAPARPLRAGRVISATLSGQGRTVKTQRKIDIWWTYCISAEGVSYSVASRQSPTVTGLVNNASIKFYEKKNQLSIIGPRGNSINFSILRKGASGKCP